MIRRILRELREYLTLLGRMATWFLMAFLAGSFVGAFVYGVKWVAGLAP